MMHALKQSHSSGYQQVPLNPESDSDDDEALLYAASSLNDPTTSQSLTNNGHPDTFNLGGSDLHDPSGDLRVKQRSSERKGRGPRTFLCGYATTKTLFPLCVMVTLIVLAVVVVSLFLVVVNYNRFSSSILSSSLVPAPSCSPIPKPLNNNDRKPCFANPPPTSESRVTPPSIHSESMGKSGGSSEVVASKPLPISPHHTTASTPSEEVSTTASVPPNVDTESPTVISHHGEVESRTEQPNTVTTSIPSSVITTPNSKSSRVGLQDESKASSSSSTSASPTEVSTSEDISDKISDTTNQASKTQKKPIAEDKMPFTTSNTHEEIKPTENEKLLPTVSGTFQVAPGEGQDDATQATPTTPEPLCVPVPKPLPDRQIQPCRTPSPSATTMPLKVEEASTTTESVPAHATAPPTKAMAPPTKTTASMKATHQTPPTQATPLHWEQVKQPSTTETSPQLFDFDEDGYPEVVVVEDLSRCISDVLALDGRSGSEVWRAHVSFAVFAVRCILDVNNDGRLDCLVSGRGAGFTALDSRDGTVLWSVDRSIAFPSYNFYFPLLVGDLDGDGGQDLVITHGGDTSYSSEQHNRSPAFFVVVSGRTGESLMEPMQIPDGHESYSSPILFTQAPADAEEDPSNQFIVFGSGGETVPGSLWAIQLESLKKHVLFHHAGKTEDNKYVIEQEIQDACQMPKGPALDNIRPVFNASIYDLSRTVDATSEGIPCPPLGSELHAVWNSHGVCLYEVVRSESKGVMLPPTMVDLNLDGQLDLVVSTFDGRTLALDGGDLSSVIWEVNYPGTESYSIPAPLYYTKDDIPDLVIRTNVGTWPNYFVSTVRVIDGSDGSLLWSFNSTHSGLLSSISVVSKTHGRDALIFFSIGNFEEWEAEGGRAKKKADLYNSGLSSEDVPMDQDGSERVARQTFAEDPPALWDSTPDDPVPDPSNLTAMLAYCGWSQSFYTASIYMVNREMVESGMELRPLASYQPFIQIKATGEDLPPMAGLVGVDPINKRHTSPNQPHPHKSDDAPEELGEAEEMDESSPHHRIGLRCGHIAKPTDLFTTPLLGDFDLDGQLDLVHTIAWSSAYFESYKTVVSASNLERLFIGAYGKGILDFDTFLPPSEQPWTQYMGKNGDNIFTLSPPP